MASRSHTTFKKRQKELARVEKQRDKVVKRMQRKEGKRSLNRSLPLKRRLSFVPSIYRSSGLKPADQKSKFPSRPVHAPGIRSYRKQM